MVFCRGNAGAMAISQLSCADNSSDRLPAEENTFRQGAIAVSEKNKKRVLQRSIKHWRSGVQQPFRRSATRLGAGIPSERLGWDFEQVITYVPMTPEHERYAAKKTSPTHLQTELKRSKTSSPRGIATKSSPSPIVMAGGGWKGGGVLEKETRSLRAEMLLEQEQMAEVCIRAYVHAGL